MAIRLGMELRAAGGAAVFTAALFLLLPYVHLVAPAPPPAFDLVEIRRVPLPDPPPLPVPAREDPAAGFAEMPRPSLTPPAPPLVPLTPVLDFDFWPGEIGGDFALAFAVETGGVSGGAFDLNDVDNVPQAIVQMRPFYPAHARRRRIEGEVVVLFVVTVQGRTEKVQVLSSVPGEVFTAAAVRAVERWRFTPALRGGEAVPVYVRQTIRFRMED